MNDIPAQRLAGAIMITDGQVHDALSPEKAGPEFKVLRKNSLGEMALATPAVVAKSLILRTVSHLYRIAKP